MNEFVVWLEPELTGRHPPHWVFCTYGAEVFPSEFQCFDTSDAPDEMVVWVTDTTQALVAYDWLLEHEWEYRTYSSSSEFTDLLARCGVC